MNLANALNAPNEFDWCLLQNDQAAEPPYSHDIYGCPADLNDIDSMFNCDITDLDHYLHSPATSSQQQQQQFQEQAPVALPVAAAAAPAVAPVDFVPQQQMMAVAVAVPSQQEEEEILVEEDPLEEFFPDLSPPRRQRNISASTASSSRVAPYATDDYRQRRDRNNEASKRSRAKRAEKFAVSRQERAELERRNIELRSTLTALEAQVADYKKMVLMVVSGQ